MQYGEWQAGHGDVRVVHSGGVIRFNSRWGYPRLHTNASYESVGIRRVSVHPDTGNLLVEHDAPGPVVSVQCTADETLISRGVRFGPSGGGGRTSIQVYSEREGRYLDLRNGADWSTHVYGQLSNLWVAFSHAVPRTNEECI